MPKIAVIIPNYNHGHLVQRSILSSVEQTDSPDEIIVIDDGSTDDSVERLKILEKEIPFLKLVLCKKNQGGLRAGMIGVQHAESDILMFRAADDVSPPDSIQHGRESFEKFPDSKIAFGELLFFCDDSSNGTIETLALSKKTKFFSPDSLLSLWRPDFNLPEPSCFVKKSAFLDQGGLMENAKWYSGWLCFTSIAFKYGLTFIPRVLNEFRLDPNSYGTSNLRNPKIQNKVLRYLVEHVMSMEQNARRNFIDSGAFSIFGEPLKNLISDEINSLPRNSHLLLKNSSVSYQFTEELPRYGIPGVVSRRMKAFVSQLTFLNNLQHPKIVIYGAGTQTLILMEIWNRFPLPPITGIVVSEAEGSARLNNLPVMGIGSLKDSHVDLFVLSSKSFELEMASKINELFPTTKRLSFWAKELTYLPNDSESSK